MQNRSILIVASHPDDEIIGCGGTICRHIEKGDIVNLIILSDGISSRSKINNNDIIKRKNCLKKSNEFIGIKEAYSLDLPDNQFDTIPLLEIVKAIEKISIKLKPDIVYTHFHNDLNIDHELTNRAVMTAFRPNPNCSVKEIYGFEVLSSTEWTNKVSNNFSPDFFVDISSYLSKKLEAIDIYFEEMRPIPYSRSKEHIEVIAKHRGFSIGRYAAEAFITYRRII